MPAEPGKLTPPKAPMAPDPAECCRRGCCPCIFDYYNDAMARWETLMRELGFDPAAQSPL